MFFLICCFKNIFVKLKYMKHLIISDLNTISLKSHPVIPTSFKYIDIIV